MDDEVYENYLLAGRIAAEARDYGKSLIRSGVSFLEVAESVESKILEKNAGIAFLLIFL
jgi:methionyl aminopeptidase